MTIDHANLARLNLNLLVALDALLTERNVTRAAARVGLRQPAMSRNVARLRTLFGDELLTRGPEGMPPTPRAAALLVPVRGALAQVQTIVSPPEAFAPHTDERMFRIGLPDSMEVLLISAVLAYFCAAAPGIRLRFFTTGEPEQILEDLDAGRLDAAMSVGALPMGRTHHKQRLLLSADFLCLNNAALVQVSQPITLDEFVAYRHVLTSVARASAAWLTKPWPRSA